jgi:hypothetical protein
MLTSPSSLHISRVFHCRYDPLLSFDLGAL